MKKLLLLLVLACIFQAAQTQSPKKINWKNIRVLVYTKNGKGYVHENIPHAAACIQKLGKEYDFAVDVADTAIVFTRDNLKKYNFLVFTSTNNDVFDTDAQRLAFRHYIEAGGGLVGIHSVVGTERNWTWFKQFIGCTFAWHPHFQKYKVSKIDFQHPSVQGIPDEWEVEDECYFEKELYPGIHTIMAHNIKTLVPGDDKEKDLLKQHGITYSTYYPAVWHHRYDGGITWVTTLGHDKKVYSEPMFVKHIMQGIQFVAENTSKIDFNKAYAKDRDSEVKK